METGAHASELLRYLSAKVDGAGPAGFDASVCVGVRVDDGTAWWFATCGRNQATRVTLTRAAADVSVGLDAQSAAWMLGAVAQPGPTHIVTGDATVWRRFVRRYFGGGSSLLGLRVAEANK